MLFSFFISISFLSFVFINNSELPSYLIDMLFQYCFTDTLLFCLEEEIDGTMLAKLPFDELRALFPKLKDRVLFTEKRDLLIKECNVIANEQLDGEDTLNESRKQTFDTCTASQTIASTQDLIDNPLLSCNDMSNDTLGTISDIDGQINEDENDDSEEPQQSLPLDFEFVSLPEEIQVIIDENELIKLRGHTNHRRILLNFVFKVVVNTYNLLYKIIEMHFVDLKSLFFIFIIGILKQVIIFYLHKLCLKP